jgi:hypothetical protein
VIGPSLILVSALLTACGSEDSAGDEIGDGAQRGASEPVASAADELVLSEAVEPMPLAVGEAAPPAPGTLATDPLAAVIESHDLAPTFISILVDEELLADPLDLELIGRSYCRGRTGCRAVIWFDRNYLARALPVEARQTEASVFAFGVDIAGQESAEWNCAVFPEMEAAGRRCLPRTERLL